jgi:cyclopropane fatty-acyl-phospholipid synthase-like methyltransferase
VERSGVPTLSSVDPSEQVSEMKQPNKDYWTGDEVTAYERKQRLLVPRKDEILDTIVDLLPFDEQHDFCAVDVGAGQGALAERILRRFEHAHVVLFDASAEMLSVAENRLVSHAPRFSTVVGDFNDVEWYKPISRSVSAVVSSIALHYLRTECRAPFLEGVYEFLDAPGYFANAGGFESEHKSIREYCDEKRLEYTQKQLLEKDGREVSLARLRERWEVESEKAGINRLLLSEQTRLLEEAGFGHVEVVWRYLSMAVVVAYKEG